MTVSLLLNFLERPMVISLDTILAGGVFVLAAGVTTACAFVLSRRPAARRSDSPASAESASSSAPASWSGFATRWAAQTAVVAGIALLGVAATMATASGAWRPLVGLPEPAVAITPGTIDLGEVDSGASVPVPVVVVNSTSETVRLIGSQNSCSCLVTDGLPQTIPPGGKATLTLTLTTFGEGVKTIPFEILTDRAEQFALPGAIRYDGISPAPTSDGSDADQVAQAPNAAG